MTELPLDLLVGGWKYSNPVFSPDGRYLAYLVQAGSQKSLFVHDMQSGLDRQLTEDFKISVGLEYGGQAIGWTADSDALIVSSDGDLFFIPVEGGKPIEIKTIGNAINPSATGNKMVYSIQAGHSMSLVTQNYENMNAEWPYRVKFEADFIYNPVLHPEDDIVAIHAWFNPNMNWNSSEIYLVNLDDESATSVAGGEGVAVIQPQFSPNGNYLTYISDKTGYYNLWVANADGSNPRPIIEEEVEHGLITWTSGVNHYCWIDNQRIVFIRNLGGRYQLCMVDTQSTSLTELNLPRGNYVSLTSNQDGMIAVEFSNYQTPNQLLLFDVDELLSDTSTKVVFKEGGISLGEFEDNFVEPEFLTFTDEQENQLSGLYYPPINSTQPEEPPLLLLVHGGPTSQFYDKFRFEVHYFTNRGWAVFGLNYRGSTGFGREFREQLNGNWGIYDPEDAASAFKFLTENKYADKDRTAIMGGSAGGLTLLMALAKYPGMFKAGIDLYGVVDLYTLAQDTHYLEAHYIDSIVGPYPQERGKYRDQSPSFHAHKIKDPLLILQGSEDSVVPATQSEEIKSKVSGIVEYKLYEGEKHGFRKQETYKDLYPRIEKFLIEHVLMV